LKTESEALELQKAHSSMNRKFLLFFDFAFNEDQKILKSKKAAINFLDERVHPTDEVGVISFSTKKGITLHEYLSQDHDKIRRVVEGLSPQEILGRAEHVNDRYLVDLEQIGHAAGGEAGAQLSRMATHSKLMDRMRYRSQVINYVQQIKDLAKALRFVPGTKNIIFFSSGIANFILYGRRLVPSGELLTREERHGDFSLRSLYEELGKELAAANCLVYPVNVYGLASAHFTESDFLGNRSLQQLAKLTNGKYFDNVNNYEEIMEEIQKMTSAYYVLGYYIDDKWDGKYHDIKVKVKRKGCKVYGQEGYFNPKPFTEYTSTEKMLHLIDLALSDKPQLQEPIRFPAHASQWKADEESNVLISVKIAGDRIKEIQGRKMEVVTLILNQKNDVVELKQEECGISQSVQDDTYYSTYVSLPPGEYDCRVIIRNLETGKGAVGSSLVTISRPPESGFSLLPPVFFVHKESPHSLEICLFSLPLA
jgi:VWFA-related protein